MFYFKFFLVHHFVGCFFFFCRSISPFLNFINHSQHILLLTKKHLHSLHLFCCCPTWKETTCSVVCVSCLPTFYFLSQHWIKEPPFLVTGSTPPPKKNKQTNLHTLNNRGRYWFHCLNFLLFHIFFSPCHQLSVYSLLRWLDYPILSIFHYAIRDGCVN